MTQDKLYTCKSCKESVQKDAKKCPHCGEKYPTVSNAKGCLSLVVIALLGAVTLSMCTNEQTSSTPENSQVSSAQSQPKWYENGGLHDKGALDWQTAPYSQKLASAADIYAFFYQQNKLSPSIASNISNVDDLRPYAENLVASLDEAFKPRPTKEENENMFANQTVSETSVILLTMQGHLK
ncbi:hypothetical protein [Vibrio parahaemolyticus]|uniref:hypothetical protein n=1 Tax=Vibrio parahaemolyticus TaxID=670 RepID=UPI002362149C|nr:hypothetical protein [Vibrio parahaemolyticus]MDQ2216366.1 hypothetical protein [Vibrio parahaemolyticus]